jgi:hypothetical protein
MLHRFDVVLLCKQMSMHCQHDVIVRPQHYLNCILTFALTCFALYTRICVKQLHTVKQDARCVSDDEAAGLYPFSNSSMRNGSILYANSTGVAAVLDDCGGGGAGCDSGTCCSEDNSDYSNGSDSDSDDDWDNVQSVNPEDIDLVSHSLHKLHVIEVV